MQHFVTGGSAGKTFLHEYGSTSTTSVFASKPVRQLLKQDRDLPLIEHFAIMLECWITLDINQFEKHPIPAAASFTCAAQWDPDPCGICWIMFPQASLRCTVGCLSKLEAHQQMTWKWDGMGWLWVAG